MMKTFPLMLFAGLILTGTECKKEEAIPETTLQFKVVDFHNANPLAGVNCSVLSINNSSVLVIGSGVTASDGSLNFNVDSIAGNIYFNMNLKDYIPKVFKSLSLELNKANERNIVMRRYDAVVQLEATNQKNTVDSLYFDLKNGGAIGDLGLFSSQVPFPIPLILQPNQTLTFNIPALGDDPATIKWTWDEVADKNNIPFKNVVIPVIGDTLVYKVTN